MSRKVWCRSGRVPKCSGPLRIISFIENSSIIEKIQRQLKLWAPPERPPPRSSTTLEYDADFLACRPPAGRLMASTEACGRSADCRRKTETGCNENSVPRRRLQTVTRSAPRDWGLFPLPFFFPHFPIGSPGFAKTLDLTCRVRLFRMISTSAGAILVQLGKANYYLSIVIY